MARVTEAEVRQIYEAPSDVELSADFSVFIDQANTFVTAELASTTLTTAQLKAVELWLVPYFINVFRPMAQGFSAGGVNAQGMGNFAYVGMLGDPYGQRAIMLDTSGVLLEKARRANAAARGRDEGAGDFTINVLSSANEDLLI